MNLAESDFVIVIKTHAGRMEKCRREVLQQRLRTNGDGNPFSIQINQTLSTV
jgi:hypothetical protein